MAVYGYGTNMMVAGIQKEKGRLYMSIQTAQKLWDKADTDEDRKQALDLVKKACQDIPEFDGDNYAKAQLYNYAAEFWHMAHDGKARRECLRMAAAHLLKA